MVDYLRRRWRLLPVLCMVWSVLAVVLMPMSAQASNVYGGGTYGTCQYGNCGITLTSSGMINDDVTPSTTTACTVQNDDVSVTTGSDAGYSLSVSDNAANSQMNGSGGGVIASSRGTDSSPAPLGANEWGYRVDGMNGFGVGPTLSGTNESIPSLPFARVPNALASPDVIASITDAADMGVSTPVWYGVCADTSLPDGTYSSSVTYTAVAN